MRRSSTYLYALMALAMMLPQSSMAQQYPPVFEGPKALPPNGNPPGILYATDDAHFANPSNLVPGTDKNAIIPSSVFVGGNMRLNGNLSIVNNKALSIDNPGGSSITVQNLLGAQPFTMTMKGGLLLQPSAVNSGTLGNDGRVEATKFCITGASPSCTTTWTPPNIYVLKAGDTMSGTLNVNTAAGVQGIVINSGNTGVTINTPGTGAIITGATALNIAGTNPSGAAVNVNAAGIGIGIQAPAGEAMVVDSRDGAYFSNANVGHAAIYANANANNVSGIQGMANVSGAQGIYGLGQASNSKGVFGRGTVAGSIGVFGYNDNNGDAVQALSNTGVAGNFQSLTGGGVSQVKLGNPTGESIITSGDVKIAAGKNLCMGASCITDWNSFVKKTGDTMTGALTITPSVPSNAFTSNGNMYMNGGTFRSIDNTTPGPALDIEHTGGGAYGAYIRGPGPYYPSTWLSLGSYSMQTAGQAYFNASYNPKVAIGGLGGDIYGTDLWVENNIHVQGNEGQYNGGRSRLRVGSAWNAPGIYAEYSSWGQPSDLILGASSDLVNINAGTFGRPYNASQLALWGSRIGDFGGGTLKINSGGNRVEFGPDDYVVDYNDLWVGGHITSNFPNGYMDWVAWNGGNPGGWTPITSDNLCVLIWDDRQYSALGSCIAYTFNGYWYSWAKSWSNPGYVHCEWNCYKYR